VDGVKEQSNSLWPAASAARGQSAPQRANGFRSLKDTWADTTTPHGRLMLTVLGGLAEFERELIRARARGHNPKLRHRNGNGRFTSIPDIT
jgi:hypothetical protein